MVAARFILFLAAIATSAVASTPGSPSEERQVQRDVQTAHRALYSGDVDTVLRYTHPRAIDLLGGASAARQGLMQAVERILKASMKVESLSFPARPEFLEGGGRRFVIVPTLIVMSANGQRLESLNYQFGVLEPGSREWKYLEGSRINKDNVQLLFPGFPASYEFPPFYRKKL